ncbi:MAG TPA: argininosuccinate lyase [Thermomicrobiales bacterium]|nr:argininosuccinate lyase [Thermomicrobiales bacterium]
MVTKLWDKGYELDPRIERFEVSDDLVYDRRLIVPDVLGSIAHAAMLTKIGLLPLDAFHALRAELANIAALSQTGGFTLDAGDEDVHTKIEGWLTAKLGDAGKMIHTGRSRNDQVLVDMRLYTREAVVPVYTAVLDACDALLDMATRHQHTPMPGYTHMQRAMLSSVGVWAGAFLESLLDNLTLLDAAVALSDQNPLGSAASYGVGLPLDRQYVSDLLGFAKVQSNVLYTQNARGKFEAAIVQACCQVMLDLSKLAQDILLFTTSEYGFFELDDSLTTGSSIMPQKKNLGAMEMLRAKGTIILSWQQLMMTMLAGLPSGYNMDYQETKRPFMESLDLVEESSAVAGLTVSRLLPNEERLLAACTPELYATDVAYDLVLKGVPFRDAYRKVAGMLDDLGDMDAHSVLANRAHQGTSGDLRLDASAEIIAARREAVADRSKQLEEIRAGLLSGTAAGLPAPPIPGRGSLPQPVGGAARS